MRAAALLADRPMPPSVLRQAVCLCNVSALERREKGGSIAKHFMTGFSHSSNPARHVQFFTAFILRLEALEHECYVNNEMHFTVTYTQVLLCSLFSFLEPELLFSACLCF